MTNNINVIMQLVEKLGWSSMPTVTTLRAVKEMYRNFNNIVAEVHGHSVSFDDFVAWVLTQEGWTSDAIFGLLICDEYDKEYSKEYTLFIRMRKDIEEALKCGYSLVGVTGIVKYLSECRRCVSPYHVGQPIGYSFTKDVVTVRWFYHDPENGRVMEDNGITNYHSFNEWMKKDRF